MLNTTFVVLISTIVSMIMAIPASYYLHKTKNSRFKMLIVLFCFLFMFIPEEIIILPEFDIMSKLGLINKYLSVILIFIAASLPEEIFILLIYFGLVPREIINSGEIDGANDFYCLFRIVVPIAKAPITVVTITTGISLWNSFLVPMLFLYDEKCKMLLPSLSGLITKHSTTPTYQMAGVFLSMLPLLITYLIFKKQIFQNSIGGAML